MTTFNLFLLIKNPVKNPNQIKINSNGEHPLYLCSVNYFSHQVTVCVCIDTQPIWRKLITSGHLNHSVFVMIHYPTSLNQHEIDFFIPDLLLFWLLLLFAWTNSFVHGLVLFTVELKSASQVVWHLFTVPKCSVREILLIMICCPMNSYFSMTLIWLDVWYSSTMISQSTGWQENLSTF